VLWIVSGPSSVGKSTFIASQRCRDLTGLPPDAPMLWPGDGPLPTALDATDALFHYNILRPINKGVAHDFATPNFAGEATWAGIVAHPVPKRAIVLVADKDTLLRRIDERSDREADGLRAGGTRYPRKRWRRLVEATDLAAVYVAWRRELSDRHIPYLMLDATGDDYPIIDDAALLPMLARGHGRR
jgi:hypothetical protein